MVDAIDGVQVCIPEPDIDDPAHGINIPAGTREIEGQRGPQLRARALRARRRLRHRPDEASAGVHRRDGATRWSPPTPWPAPDRLVQFLDAATKSLQLDEGLEQPREDRQARRRSSRTSASTRSSSSPSRGSTPPDDPNRIRWLPEAEQVWQAMINDEPLAPQVPRRRDHRGAPARLAHRRRRPTRASPSGSPTGTPSSPGRRVHAVRRADRGRHPGRDRQRALRMTRACAPDEARREAERKRRLAEVFGDVLPETTTDERDPGVGRPRGRVGRATPGTATRCRRTTAEVRRRAVCPGPSRSRISSSSAMSSGVPGSSLGKKRSFALV